jgi:ribosome-associated protein
LKFNVLETLQKAALAAQFADEKKAEDIVLLDLQDLCNFTDIFLICTGNNRIQINAIREGIIDGFRKMGMKAPRDDAERDAKWIVLDYGDVVVHIMSHEARSFYRLESLWGDARRIEWQAALEEASEAMTSARAGASA